jgi:hypothetical protein
VTFDVTLLRELCVASNAHDARAHEPNASPTPSKFEFEVIPFGDGQSGDIKYLASESRCVWSDLLQDTYRMLATLQYVETHSLRSAGLDRP